MTNESSEIVSHGLQIRSVAGSCFYLAYWSALAAALLPLVDVREPSLFPGDPRDIRETCNASAPWDRVGHGLAPVTDQVKYDQTLHISVVQLPNLDKITQRLLKDTKHRFTLLGINSQLKASLFCIGIWEAMQAMQCCCAAA